jgi:hypothetical protein
MALKESKRKCDDEEDRVSRATLKRRWPFGDYNDDDSDDSDDDSSSSKEASSSEEEVSSEEE